jgi:REP element-mobilizing transposase RayT
MSRPQRIPGFEYRGPYRYFLTFCTRDRRDCFRDRAIVTLVLMQFRRVATTSSFAVLAYCLMPDHAHLLVEGLTARADLRRFAKAAKQASGQAYARQAGRPLWQEGYYERVLRPNDDALGVARYIIANPVRAGLVVTPGEYPYLGSDVWTMDELLGSVI